MVSSVKMCFLSNTNYVPLHWLANRLPFVCIILNRREEIKYVGFIVNVKICVMLHVTVMPVSGS